MGLLSRLKALDANPKVNEDFFTKTMSGGIITIASSVIMVILFLSELREAQYRLQLLAHIPHSQCLFTTVKTHHELIVDTNRGETIKIYVNVTFPHIPCSWLSLDTMDVSGDLHLDIDHDIYKQRLSKAGAPVREAERHDVHATKKAVTVVGNTTCGSCYGAEDQEAPCCNTCDEVRAAYRRRGWALSGVEHIEQCKHDAYMDSIREQRGEGCRMWGHVEVNKVAGNFHFAPGKSYQQGGMHVHDMAPFGDTRMDFSHIIHKLSFGTPYPGMKNPLDGVSTVPKAASKEEHTGMYQYFLKVVPTSYTAYGNSSVIQTNQYSVTENFREQKGPTSHTLPGAFFFYDLSPIKVRITESRMSFMHFLTSVCAIVGGVFTVAGILDTLWYQGGRLIKKKQELGKFS